MTLSFCAGREGVTQAFNRKTNEYLSVVSPPYSWCSVCNAGATLSTISARIVSNRLSMISVPIDGRNVNFRNKLHPSIGVACGRMKHVKSDEFRSSHVTRIGIKTEFEKYQFILCRKWSSIVCNASIECANRTSKIDRISMVVGRGIASINMTHACLSLPQQKLTISCIFFHVN